MVLRTDVSICEIGLQISKVCHPEEISFRQWSNHILQSECWTLPLYGHMVQSDLLVRFLWLRDPIEWRSLSKDFSSVGIFILRDNFFLMQCSGFTGLSCKIKRLYFGSWHPILSYVIRRVHV